jgi:pyridoxamine 5'-phosphate oxidase
MKVGIKLDDLNDDIARKNFRVVVIKPESVEQTDLNDPDKARRYLYTYDDDTGEWTMTEEWP